MYIPLECVQLQKIGKKTLRSAKAKVPTLFKDPGVLCALPALGIQDGDNPVDQGIFSDLSLKKASGSCLGGMPATHLSGSPTDAI